MGGGVEGTVGSEVEAGGGLALGTGVEWALICPRTVVFDQLDLGPYN
jgi:hypothetical protein